MTRDKRWPALLLIILRGVQLFFSVLVLGLSSYLLSIETWWTSSMALVSALFTIIYCGINFFLLFSNLLLPLAVVITDAFLFVFWLVSIAGFGGSGYLDIDCAAWEYYVELEYYLDSTGLNLFCQVTKADFGISFLVLISFIGTLVVASMAVHKNRKDLRGAKYNSGLDPSGNPLRQAGTAVPMNNVQLQPPAGGYYPQEQKRDYYPQSPPPVLSPQLYQTTTAPQYYQQPHVQQPLASPPATPAPYTPAQSTGGYSVGMPPPPVNTAAPPVSATEMPAR